MQQLAMKHLEQSMNDFVKLLEGDFQLTVRTWKVKPTFKKSVKKNNKSIEGKVSTDNDIYRFVSGGTRVRYATMTPDFVAKTRPGNIPSGPGRGGVLYISKQKPRPGIEAREFDKQIKNKRGKEFAKTMLDGINKFIMEVN